MEAVGINRNIEVYIITNTINDKAYIGQTKRGLGRRFLEHSKADSLIGRAIRKYGIENFKIEALEKIKDPDLANELEHKNILKHGCVTPKGYNANEIGRLEPGTFVCVKKIIPSLFFMDNIYDSRFLKYYIKILKNTSSSTLFVKKEGNNSRVKNWKDVCLCVGIKNQNTSSAFKKEATEKRFVSKTKEGFIVNKRYIRYDFKDGSY